jgi:threonine aldolase
MMNHQLIDLRSDTVTRPTTAMLEAMMQAPVGDDVFGEDPTINALEKKAAKLFAKEAALFCPSGTMTNQVSIKTHTQPGDEVIVERSNHVYFYEAGGIAFHSGCSVRLINGERGKITPADISANINPMNDHNTITRVVSIENTCNRGGGSFYSVEEMKELSDTAREAGLKIHLDGARIFNALVELNAEAAEVGPMFDSISFCLSKGLGCPVGSLIVADSDFIKRARKYRKIFGGGMRQAGILAAAGIYALDHNIQRLKEDHAKAKAIGKMLQKKSFIDWMMPVDTNIIIFRLNDDFPAQKFSGQLKSEDILSIPIGNNQIRMVTHLDISNEMTNKVMETIDKI